MTVFADPKKDEATGGTGGTINIQVIESEDAFEKNIKDILEVTPQQVPGLKFLSNKNFRVPTAKAHLFTSTLPYQDLQLQNYQLFVQKDKKVYIVTAASRQSDWKYYQKGFLKALGSFRIK